MEQVIVPGAAGEYGVTADHVPVVAQLKPGVLQILHSGTSEPEKYFVAGGFSITHDNSVTVSENFEFDSDFAFKFQHDLLTLFKMFNLENIQCKGYFMSRGCEN